MEQSISRKSGRGSRLSLPRLPRSGMRTSCRPGWKGVLRASRVVRNRSKGRSKSALRIVHTPSHPRNESAPITPSIVRYEWQGDRTHCSALRSFMCPPSSTTPTGKPASRPPTTLLPDLTPTPPFPFVPPSPPPTPTPTPTRPLRCSARPSVVLATVPLIPLLPLLLGDSSSGSVKGEEEACLSG